MTSGGPFLYPNVTSIPKESGVSQTERVPKKGIESEFDQVYKKTLDESGQKQDLNQVREPLKFSAHAYQRLQDRKIKLDPALLSKINDAVDKADAKGVGETLILTKDAALIVSVKNRTVITALDKNSMTGNVFTNIDGAVIV